MQHINIKCAALMVEAVVIASRQGHVIESFFPIETGWAAVCEHHDCFAKIKIEPLRQIELTVYNGTALTTVCKSEDDHEPHIKHEN